MKLKEMEKADFTIYSDGGSRGNPGEAAYGFVIYDAQNKVLAEHGQRIGVTTNNVAEYSGIIAALKWIGENSKIEKPNIHVFLDSQLATRQLSGEYKVKNENMRNLFFTVKELESKVAGKISYSSIPREMNKEADRLVNLALDNKF